MIDLPDRALRDSVAIHFVNQVLESAKRANLDPVRLLNSTNIPPGLTTVTTTRVSPKQYAALWRLVSQEMDDELFGQDSRRMKAGSLAMICYAVATCQDLRRALIRAQRFLRLLLDDHELEIRVDGPATSIVVRHRTGVARVFAHEYLLILVYGLACWLVGRRIPITNAGFAYPEPSHVVEYETIFSTQMLFDAAETFLAFDSAYLLLRVKKSPASVKTFLQEAPANLVVKYRNSTGVCALVRRCMQTQRSENWMAFSDLAKQMRVSPATLRRRLQHEGTSYQEIKEQMRRELALRLMSDSGNRISEIGALVGFSESSAFHRAFKKWTGMPPGRFRDVMPIFNEEQIGKLSGRATERV